MTINTGEYYDGGEEKRERESFVNVRSDEKGRGSVLRNDNNANRGPSGRAARP